MISEIHFFLQIRADVFDSLRAAEDIWMRQCEHVRQHGHGAAECLLQQLLLASLQLKLAQASFHGVGQFGTLARFGEKPKHMTFVQRLNGGCLVLISGEHDVHGVRPSTPALP